MLNLYCGMRIHFKSALRTSSRVRDNRGSRDGKGWSWEVASQWVVLAMQPNWSLLVAEDLSAKAKGAASQRVRSFFLSPPRPSMPFTVPKSRTLTLASQIIDDKTFGLKNKNKSKKVQAYVNQVVIATKASIISRPAL